MVAIVAAVIVVRGSPTTIVGEPDAGAASSLSASGAADATTSPEPMASASAAPGPLASASGAAAAGSAAPHAANAPLDSGALEGASQGSDAGAGDARSDGGATRPHIVNIDESHAGKIIGLAPGQQLVATLDANPTTGFDWAVTKAPAALGSPEMEYVSSGNAPGSPGKRILTWTLKAALPAGEHAVELGYARSFEKGVPPFKTYRFKVRAAPR